MHRQLVQLFRHPGPATTARAGPVLVPDMRKQHHVTPLPVRWWPVPPGSKAAIRDAHQAAGMRFGQQAVIFVEERELHGFGAQETAFFRMSLSAMRIRFSRRSRSFSRKRFWSGSAGLASSETPLCSESKVQPLNQTQPDALSGHSFARCELHPA